MKHYFKKVLSALALAFVVIVAAGAVKASAATLTYDPINDTIVADGACVVYVLKSEEACNIKASATCFDLGTTAIPLSDLGIKEGTAVYLHVETAAYEEDKEGVKPNFTLAAPTAYKAVGVIDYTQADVAGSMSVLSATVTTKDKKEIADAVILWKGEDDDNYALATPKSDAAAEVKKAAFTSEKLAAMLENGGTITIKVEGNGTTRTSKAFKVKIAKQAKVPSVKLDVKKNTFSIKNGFDFANATKATDETYTAGTWFTILPYLKDAKTKTADLSIVGTTTYLPLDKKDKNALKTIADTGAKVSYTAYKFKALNLDTLVSTINADTTLTPKIAVANGFNIAVRKSATNKKPASQVAYFDIAGQKAAPQMYTVANTSSCTTIATADELKFKATEIVNSTTRKSAEGTAVVAWTGIGENVAPYSDAVIDDAAAKYEMAVVKVADYISTEKPIDWSTVSWKAIKKGTSISDKTKTKYTVVGASAPTEATIKAGSKKADGTDKYGLADTIILIRRAGVKGKTINDTILASTPLVTYVYKDTTTKKYNWEIAADQALVGADAYSYKLTLLTWQKTDSGYDYVASDVTVEGYEETANDAIVELPALADGQAYKITSDALVLTGCTAESGNKAVKIAKAAKDAKQDATIKVDTEVVVNIKYVGIEKDAVKLESNATTKYYLGTAIDLATYSGNATVGDKTYTATLPTAPTGAGWSITGTNLTVNEGKEINITIVYAEKTE